MRRYIATTFQDQMGLQWTIELRETENSELDEKGWDGVCKLWDRIVKSIGSQQDGKGIDTEADLRRSREYPKGGSIPRT